MASEIKEAIMLANLPHALRPNDENKMAARGQNFKIGPPAFTFTSRQAVEGGGTLQMKGQ